ncbi:3'-5' exonuclease [Dysgonomonas alginatilytica]|uniref:3'-5' exonuclease n=1 Tax=Dysgonomonas alginatilytica TaxID=1605892 RepID=A0A2V3PLH9_9BACT|nr:3'-5' exonuclease [Dysgonomonas alginatilytica]PXV62095.1 3'-5' exonuclease [Dysgonomonas alginatilytica]
MVSTITKEEIATLPIAIFPGRIIVVQTEKEAQKAVAFLEQHSVIGFDTETRPSFKKGLIRTIALMQLSTEDTCFLFRLNFIDIPECLKQILISPDIKKIGLSLKDDFSAIRKRMQLEPKNFIELQAFVKKFGIEDNGLQRIYAILFGEKISKSQRLSNWEADVLSEAQQKYASLDAWACLQIYNKLIRLSPNLAEE